MWSGWTDKEKQEILSEVEIDVDGLNHHYESVARSQFLLWTLVPVFGCITVWWRYASMKSSVKQYKEWSAASKIAITARSILVVSQPAVAGPGQVSTHAYRKWPMLLGPRRKKPREGHVNIEHYHLL
jgi:hypothetical protein